MKEKIYIFIPASVLLVDGWYKQSATGSEFITSDQLGKILTKNNFSGGRNNTEGFLFSGVYYINDAKEYEWVFIVDADQNDKIIAGCRLRLYKKDGYTHVELEYVVSLVTGSCRRLCKEALVNVIANLVNCPRFRGDLMPLFIHSINNRDSKDRTSASHICYMRSFLDPNLNSYDFALVYPQTNPPEFMHLYDSEHIFHKNAVFVTRDSLEIWFSLFTIYTDLQKIGWFPIKFGLVDIDILFIPTIHPGDYGGKFVLNIEKYGERIKSLLRIDKLNNDYLDMPDDKGVYAGVSLDTIVEYIFATELIKDDKLDHLAILRKCKNPLDLLKSLRDKKFPTVAFPNLSGVALDVEEAKNSGYRLFKSVYTYYGKYSDADTIIRKWKKPQETVMLDVYADYDDKRAIEIENATRDIDIYVEKWIDASTDAKRQKMGLGAGNIDFNTKQ
jgi:hypothetical protein